MEEDLKLDGKAPKTIKLYLAAVRGLANHYDCSPSKLSEEQVRQYLLFLIDKRKLKPNSMRSILAGIQFFYRVTVPRDWKTLAAARIPKTRTLPAVLLPEQVWQLIEATKALHFQVFFRTAYTCGLRPGDTRHLTPHDVDADRMLLHVRTTKGRNDRCVPLPQATLEALREYWKTHRNPKWLFPSRAALATIAQADKPISERGVQRAFAQVVQSLGFKKKGLCPHTLRHSYATALLEEGVNLKVLQTYLGHKNLQATEVYLHLTQHSDEKARRVVERLMNGPPDVHPTVEDDRPETP
jgi:site-specific recombinase XerD